jgi:hypothetical protein
MISFVTLNRYFSETIKLFMNRYKMDYGQNKIGFPIKYRSDLKDITC